MISDLTDVMTEVTLDCIDSIGLTGLVSVTVWAFGNVSLSLIKEWGAVKTYRSQGGEGSGDCCVTHI